MYKRTERDESPISDPLFQVVEYVMEMHKILSYGCGVEGPMETYAFLPDPFRS